MASQTAGQTNDGAWTISAFLRECARRLSAGGIANGAREAEVLLAHGLRMSREQLVVCSGQALDERQQAACERIVQRRLEREPVAYITGRREFWSREFRVTPDVLIPRAETESLVEIALAHAAELSDRTWPLRIADMGTGSGAIAVALASELPSARLVATDVSEPALALARLNAEQNRVAKRIQFFAGDLFGALPIGASFDLIVSNPPYIRRGEIAALQPEVSRWEPAAALDGGADGLVFYRRFAADAPGYLAQGGRLLVEIGAGTGSAVSRIFQQAGWVEISIHADYAGRQRVAAARRPPRVS